MAPTKAGTFPIGLVGLIWLGKTLWTVVIVRMLLPHGPFVQTAAELLGRQLVECFPDAYIGIVMDTQFATTLRNWSYKRHRKRSWPALKRTEKVVADVKASAIAPGFGNWCGVLYVGAGANAEDALVSVRDLRRMLKANALPIAATGVPVDAFRARGDDHVIDIPRLVPQTYIDRWHAEWKGYVLEDTHHGRDGHWMITRLAAEAYAALDRGERGRYRLGTASIRRMGTCAGPKRPRALLVQRGRCYVLGDDAGTGPPSGRMIGAVHAFRHGRLVRNVVPEVGDELTVTAVPMQNRRDELTLPLLDDIQALTEPLYYILDQASDGAE